jgi:hypothetical protein
LHNDEHHSLYSSPNIVRVIKLKRVPGTLSLGVKRPGPEADHSPPSSAEVKNAWSYTSTPQYVFMTWYLVKHRDNFTNFTFYFTHIVQKTATWNDTSCSVRCEDVSFEQETLMFDVQFML